MNKTRALILCGSIFICISLLISGLIFYPVLAAEIRYQLKRSPTVNQNYSPNQEFRIIIPKIDLNSKVLSNIDPYNKEAYLAALSQGVAQAKGSTLPGSNGDIFLFAHSTNSPFISYYNAPFYLINKLTPSDEIYLSYQGKNYKYVVTETKIINPSEVQYLKTSEKKQSLTLMTCWPPGTTLKRLLVISHLAQQ